MSRSVSKAALLGLLGATAALLTAATFSQGTALAFDHSFIGQFSTLTNLVSTVPSNGDENPYGIVTVPTSVGSLTQGSLLVSNFNDSENLQGTGTTIVQITPAGTRSEFAQINPATLPGPCPGGVGLTTALAVLPDGYVVVGSLPTSNGKAATAEAGCLIVLDSSGHVVETVSGPLINGPWDLTAVTAGDDATLFVTNVLNGTVTSKETPIDQSTVVRIQVYTSGHHAPVFSDPDIIANGFPERTSGEALVVGPTGVGLDQGTLYVADTQGNRIAAIPNALFRRSPLGGGGITVAKDGFLNGPLGLTIAPNGDILTANGGDGDIVETTPFGAEFQPFDTGAEAGGLFGLTVSQGRPGIYFVNDLTNELDFLH